MPAPGSTDVGFGIFGLGMVAGFHAQALAHTAGAKLMAVATRRPDVGRSFAERHGARFAGTTIEELLREPGVDVVCVATSSGAHLEPALAAIQAGRHVVVEKPIEITLERVDRILDAARRRGVWVVPVFQNRFGAGAGLVKQAIEAGRLGRPVLVSAYVKWHRDARYYSGTRGSIAADGGGAVMAQAIHAIDLLQWFAGMPAEVFAWTARRVHEGIEAEDTAAAALRFPTGALGAIEATTAAWPGWRRKLEICGESGSVALEDDEVTRWDLRDERPDDRERVQATRAPALGSGASLPNAISFVGHQRQFEDLVQSLRSGRSPSITGAEGRKAVALVCACYESARTGRPVRLAAPA